MVESLERLNAGVTAAVRHVFNAPPSRLAHALLASSQAHPATVSTAGAVHTSIFQDIQNFALNWSPVVMMLFFAALIYLMWRTLKVMPRTKPQQIRPASKGSVSFGDIAGVDEAKAELAEIVEFMRDPKAFAADRIARLVFEETGSGALVLSGSNTFTGGVVMLSNCCAS